MKKYFSFVIFFFGFIAIHAQDNPEYLKKKKGTVKIYWDNSKIIKEEGEVSNHLKTGLWKSYDVQGNISAEDHYQNGIRNGAHVDFYPSGAIKSQGNYTEGIKTGKWETFAEKGTRTELNNYDDKGKQVGVQETFWYRGSIMKYSILDSAGNSKVYSYNRFGKLISIETFSKDGYNGLQYFYQKSENSKIDADTFPVKVMSYNFGKRDGISKYFKDGKLIKEENY